MLYYYLYCIFNNVLSYITPHPLPKLLVLWRLCPRASLCYPYQRAFSWGVGLPPPSSPLVLCIYVLLVYCVKHLLYCIVQIFCTNILPLCILFSLVPVGIPSIDYFLHLNLFVFILSWIGVGWSVQVHFGGGFLKPSPLHGNCWVQQTPCPTCFIKH